MANIDCDGSQLLYRVLEEVLARFGKPEIFGTGQTSQFASMAVTSVLLLREQIANRMAGRGVWRDDVIIQRLWRSVKYEEVYRHAYGSVRGRA